MSGERAVCRCGAWLVTREDVEREVKRQVEKAARDIERAFNDD